MAILVSSVLEYARLVATTRRVVLRSTGSSISTRPCGLPAARVFFGVATVSAKSDPSAVRAPATILPVVQPGGRRGSVKWATFRPGTSVSDPGAGGGVRGRAAPRGPAVAGAALDAVEEVAGWGHGLRVAAPAPRLDERLRARPPAALDPAIDGRPRGECVGGDLVGHDVVAVPPKVERALGAAELDLGALQRRGGRVRVVLRERHEGAARIHPEHLEGDRKSTRLNQ